MKSVIHADVVVLFSYVLVPASNPFLNPLKNLTLEDLTNTLQEALTAYPHP